MAKMRLFDFCPSRTLKISENNLTAFQLFSVKSIFLSGEKEFLRNLFISLELHIWSIETCENTGSRISRKTADILTTLSYSLRVREYRDLFFFYLFFHRICLFIKSLLAVSRFSRTLSLVLPLMLTLICVFVLPSDFRLYAHPQYCVRFILKCMEIF